MSSIAEKVVGSSLPPQKKKGILSHDQGVDLIKSMQQDFEYRQYVTGRVKKVYSDQSTLPTRTRKDGVETYVWEKHGNIDVVLNHSKKEVLNVGPLCATSR